jgi:predicted alpha/beta hydrolase family esterase
MASPASSRWTGIPPHCDDWTGAIEKALAPFPLETVILVGHSLACCTIVHWAKRYGHTIRGAFLAGPSDVEAPSYPPGTSGFGPMPLFRLPFPSMVVASTDDFYVTPPRAAWFAEQWGSRLVNIGAHGHINSASGLEDWPEGYALLKTLY